MSAARRSPLDRPSFSDSHPAPFEGLPPGLLGQPFAAERSGLGGEEIGHGYPLGGGAKAGAGAKGGAGARNFSPTAQNDAVTTGEATPVRLAVLANDSDRDGDPLAVTHLNGVAVSPGGTVTLASGAKVTLNADFTLTYNQGTVFTSLNSGQTALDSFSYRVSDGRGGTAQASVNVTLTGEGGTTGSTSTTANAAPVAANDAATTDEATVRTGNVLANDRDPDGDVLRVTAVNGVATSVDKAITLASGAKFMLRADGSYSYDPSGAFNSLNSGQTATDRIAYTVGDGRGGTATASLTVTINGLGDASGSTTAPITTPTYYMQDLLLSSSQRWNASSPYGTAVTVSYSFLESVPSYYASGDWAYNSFTSFNATQRDAVRQALSHLESLTNISFTEVSSASSAAITFGFADIPTYIGYAYYPAGNGQNSRAGDVWIDIAYAGSSLAPGSTQYKTLLHEIGHAVGLDHVNSLTGAENTRMYTVMSYNAHPTSGGEPATYMPYDIATLQYLYGADRATASGDTVYRYADLANRVMTIWDGGGVDTLDLSAATVALRVDLRPGAFSTVATSGQNNLAIAYGTMIENVVGGSGADILVGNGANNRLDGGAGADIFRFFTGWGQDVIGDFVRGVDKLDLAPAGLGYADLGIAVLADRTVVTAGASSITLLGVAGLSQSDFLLIA